MRYLLGLVVAVTLIVPSVGKAQWSSPQRLELKKFVQKKLGKVEFVELKSFFGDHNGDGIEDALVFAYYAEADGGNSTYVNVMLFTGTSKGYDFVKAIPNVFGQDPRAPKFSNGNIKITLTTLGPNDARCCPTSKKTYTIPTR